MLKSNYELEVLINGHPAKEFYKDNKNYIEGRKGVEYQIRVKNNGSRRILAVPTVDGLSVMNGKTASYESPGYIVSGYSSVTIKGWRTSDKEVASFYFSDPEQSYAEKIDKGGNIGIIGCAIFREKEVEQVKIIEKIIEKYPWNYGQPYCNRCGNLYYGHHHMCPSYWYNNINLTYTAGTTTSLMATGASGAKGSAMSMSGTPTSNFANNQLNASSVQSSNHPTNNLGTGFGETKQDSVTKVSFQDEKTPDAVFEIHYNTKENLEKLGIDFKETPKYVAPRAFPGEYCQPPK